MSYHSFASSFLLAAVCSASACAVSSFADVRAAAAHPVQKDWIEFGCNNSSGCRYVKVKYIDGYNVFLVEDMERIGIFPILIQCKRMRYKHVDAQVNDWVAINPGTQMHTLVKEVCPM